jgi:hypothetical protein
MKDVQETLDRLVPEPMEIADWEAVLRDARPRRRSIVLQVSAVTVLAALAALFITTPWKGSERVGILDRALGAVGDQPITHAVLRGDWGGTLVDLKTGKRTPLYGEDEIWYDASRNLAHQVSRFGGTVESEEINSPDRSATPFTVLARDYRKALEEGTARVVGRDTFDGRPVYWITIRRLMLPDVADNRDHEFAEEVAISTETFKPVAIRALRDRRAFSTQRVLELESVSTEEADFSADPAASLDGRAMMAVSDPIPLEQAAAVLGRTPLWLGSSYAGMPLGQAQKTFSRTGSAPVERLVTGARAERLRGCLRDRPVNPCPRTTGAIVQRGGKTYELGRSTFGQVHTGVTFFYGSVGDEPGTFKKEDASPLMAKPHLLVTQTTDPELRSLTAWRAQYLPPDGSVVVVPPASGYLVHDGLYVTIQASDEKTILGAVRALRPMPASSAGSGAGG